MENDKAGYENDVWTLPLELSTTTIKHRRQHKHHNTSTHVTSNTTTRPRHKHQRPRRKHHQLQHQHRRRRKYQHTTATTPAPTPQPQHQRPRRKPRNPPHPLRADPQQRHKRPDRKNYAKYRYRKGFNRDEVTVEQIMAISVGTMLFLVSLTCAADYYDNKAKEKEPKEAAKKIVKKSKTVVSPRRATQ